MTEKQAHQNRTAIVHFGATKQDYLNLVQAEDRGPLIEYLQAPLTAQLSPERHKPDCQDTSRYTLHAFRERQLQGWLGPLEAIPICRTRCRSCHRIAQLHPAVSSPRCRLLGEAAGDEFRDGTEQQRDGYDL